MHQLSTTKLTTPATEEEFRQLVPYNWSPFPPYTFLLILSVITRAAWSSRTCQFPPIHFQMAIPESAWALDQAVSAWCNPHRYWWLPWNTRVQLARAEPGLPGPNPGGEQARGRYWSRPFNMLICPVAASVIARLDTSKGNCFQSRDVFFNSGKHLKLKTNEFKHQVHRSAGRYSSAPQTEMFDVWKDRLVN